jgi:hydrogenase maturation protease
VTVVVGGVAHLYQGDFDFGRVVVEELQAEELGPEVVVEEFSYGAVAVAQRLQELSPEALVLVGAAERGRAPGTVERRVVDTPPATPEDVQWAISAAVTGYLALDLVVEVAHGLDALPGDTVVVEVEPAQIGPATVLSPQATAALPQALELVRSELRRVLQPR